MVRRKRILSLILAVMMPASLLLLPGCSMQDIKDAAKSGSAIGAKWVNSEIYGAISADTPANVKDDFFTAVNKDWILAQKPGPSGQIVDLFKPEETVNSQIVTLLTDPSSTGYENNTDVGMSREEIMHAAELVATFAGLAADTEKRTGLGVEPLRPFLEAIENISCLDEFNAYLLDFHGSNIIGAPFITLSVDSTMQDPEKNTAKIYPIDFSMLTLRDSYPYRSIGTDEILLKEINSELVRLILTKLGYSPKECSTILADAYRYEMRLAAKKANSQHTKYENSYEENYSARLTLDEISELLGDFPAREIIRAYGYDSASEYCVFEPDYMKRLAKLYNEKYLEEIKAYYIMHTVVTCADLLDPATKDEVYYILNRGVTETEEDVLSATDETEEVKTAKALMKEYISQYIPAPFEMLYIAAYCSESRKAQLTEMEKDIRASVRKFLAEEEWMSEEGRKNCIEKLDCMTANILFPDSYISYQGLDFSGDSSLIEMVRDVLFFERSKRAQFIDKPVDRSLWDLAVLPTTTVNAFNMPSSNSINIMAGICAGGTVFDENSPYEVNLARLGTIVGHEITHSFDSQGYMYDKYGRETDTLLTPADKEVFTSKVFSLAMWYAAIPPMPGVSTYGANVSGEAIADFGGMKSALGIAKGIDGFDYDLFFRSYASMWRKVNTEEMEKAYISGDVHPLAYLRTNVTVQQFDEFLETYSIKPGDGMYLAAEDRITLW